MNNSVTTLVLTIVALAVVLVIAWLILRALAAMGLAKNNSGRLRIVESVPVGTRERLVLVELDSREYLIGVSTGGLVQINTQTQEQLHSETQ